MIPAVQAMLAENPELVTQKVDLFACTSTLGGLLRFVRGTDKSFRFLVEVVGNTVFFIRHENSPTELIPDVRGYGHTFPEAYTTWNADVKGSVSHQRLVRYDLGGLDCVVRFQCDGYLEDRSAEDSKRIARDKIPLDLEKNDSLDAVFGNIKLTRLVDQAAAHGTSLEVRSGGHRVPQKSVFDLKTRSSLRSDLHVLEDELPRLWIAQIPNFILAYHTRGVFDTPRPQDVWDDVKTWERENQNDIIRLGCLLRKIISAAKAREDGKLEVYCKGSDRMELREQIAGEHAVLPPDLRSRWMMESMSDTDSVGGASLSGPDDSHDDSDNDSDLDYTACSADQCGYCGRCSY